MLSGVKRTLATCTRSVPVRMWMKSVAHGVVLVKSWLVPLTTCARIAHGPPLLNHTYVESEGSSMLTRPYSVTALPLQ